MFFLRRILIVLGCAMTFPATAAKTAEVAMVAGGCFWGVEDLIRKLPGVKETETGYTGGFIPGANRQGNDTGTQYRSAIFYLSDAQKKTAKKVTAKVDATGFWKGKVVTEILPAGEFYRAEDYHQKYLVKNPGGYTCHYERPFVFGN